MIRTAMKAAVLAVVFSGAMSLPVLADEASKLQLKPCTIELVDGTKVKGHLASQFDMPDHLIVYSPRFGTVRSFLREHVHALTVDGKREQLRPKRELSDEDKTLLGRMEWPDEPPARGPKPAHTTETWAKPKALLVWAKPGIKNLRSDDPSNWLMNGRPVKEFEYTEREPFVIDAESGKRMEVSSLFDTDTDVLIPVSAKMYRIGYSSEQENIGLECRHLTTDVNAIFRPRNISRMAGNLWNRGGRGAMSGRKWVRFGGEKNTFIINDIAHPGLGPDPIKPGLSYMQNFYAHEVYFDKGTGSVYLSGPLAAKYHMKALSGRVIVGGRGMLMYASSSPFVIEKDAVVELRSGGILAYRGSSLWGREKNDYRMVVKGTLQGGSPEGPLESDCYLGVATLEHPEEGDLPRLILSKGAAIKVFSADPKKARMVITNDKRDTGKYVSMVVEHADGLNLEGVVFDYFQKGGILLADMGMRDRFKVASFGEHNAVEPDKLFAPIPSPLVQGQWQYPKGAPVPKIDPAPGVYVKGQDTVRVTLTADGADDVRIRYTLDGTAPDLNSHVYDGAISLDQTTEVRARCFKDGQRLGPAVRARYVFDQPAEGAAGKGSP